MTGLPKQDSAPGRPRAATPTLGWLAGGLLLLAVVLLVTHRSEERALAQLVRRAEPLWLLAACGLQALTYVCAAAVWQRALAYHGVAVGVRGLVPLGLVKLFTDQAVPSAGMSGTLLVVRALRGRGIPKGIGVATVLLGLVAFYVAYGLATAAAVAILWHRGELRSVILVPSAVLFLLTAVLPLAILLLRGRMSRLPAWLERLPGVRDVAATLRDAPSGGLLARRVLVETAALQFAVFVLDALTLATTLRAVGSPAPFSSAFASFVIASVVATLAWVPGGLGTFEGTCVAMLHLQGTPAAAGLAATLLLRGFSFWLPMLPGFALAHREAGRVPDAGP
jgi:glycosyltransferase 2 family protein